MLAPFHENDPVKVQEAIKRLLGKNVTIRMASDGSVCLTPASSEKALEITEAFDDYFIVGEKEKFSYGIVRIDESFFKKKPAIAAAEIELDFEDVPYDLNLLIR